jgi:hypothetical protein
VHQDWYDQGNGVLRAVGEADAATDGRYRRLGFGLGHPTRCLSESRRSQIMNFLALPTRYIPFRRVLRAFSTYGPERSLPPKTYSIPTCLFISSSSARVSAASALQSHYGRPATPSRSVPLPPFHPYTASHAMPMSWEHSVPASKPPTSLPPVSPTAPTTKTMQNAP